MPKKHKSRWLGLMFLSLLAGFPIGVGIYFADPGNNVFFQATGRESLGGVNFKKESRVLQDKVFLLRDSSVTVNRTRLIYRGLRDKRILLEYYLLEMDPDCPYQSRISSSEAGGGIRMGDAVFRLVSVGRNALTLQIDHVYKSL